MQTGYNINSNKGRKQVVANIISSSVNILTPVNVLEATPSVEGDRDADKFNRYLEFVQALIFFTNSDSLSSKCFWYDVIMYHNEEFELELQDLSYYEDNCVG